MYLRTSAAALISVAGLSCDSAPTGPAPGGAPVDPTGNTGIVFNTPSLGPECITEADCPEAETCHPIAGACVTRGQSCQDHADCPGGTFCDGQSQACLQSVSGSPCAADRNCTNAVCNAGACGCTGFQQAQEGVGGPLDIYFIFDRTGSMGDDCDYTPGGTPEEDSKACYATYALPDYLINVEPVTDTRLAFQFMSQPGDGCDGSTYSAPLVPLTQLPVTADHELVTNISEENFRGGNGTQIEGALRGIAQYTANNATPGREMIGVLMTDGDPNGCEEDVDELADVLSNHLAETGVRTFIIGMDGATEENLERLAIAGGATPHDDYCGELDTPCHYWNVGDGSGDAIASALQAIIVQATPLPCEYPLSNIKPPQGMTLDLSKINVTLTGSDGVPTTIVQVPAETSCPTDQPAWFYDNPAGPMTIQLCDVACNLVAGAENGARVNVVGGCQDTVILR